MKHQAVISKITELWNESERILLTGASNFDGDALGCVLALAEFGQSQGKQMVIVNEKPLSPLYVFIDNGQVIHTKVPPGAYDLIIICDTGSFEMLGSVYHQNTALFESTTKVNIDHHCSCYGDVCWSTCSYENTSATMMVGQFIEMIDANGITPYIATTLLLGLYFDTECFRNLNTSPHGLRFAASMMEKGADHAGLIRNLYQSTPQNYIGLYGEVLSSLSLVADGNGAVARVTPQLFEKYAITPDCLGNELVNHYLRSLNTKFVVLIKDTGEECRMSFRSKDQAYNMRALAEVFGGG
jgi:phosphoesterase RecJ-like protein